MNAHLFCDGDDRAADARIAGGLENPVAFLQRHIFRQKKIGGRRIDHQHRKLLRIDPFGQGEQDIGFHLGSCRPCRGAARIQHAIAFLQAGHVRADLRNTCDAFIADGSRQIRLHAIQAAHHHEIGRVDRRELHIDDDFARPRRPWIGEGNGLHDFPRFTKCVDLNTLHDVLLISPVVAQ